MWFLVLSSRYVSFTIPTKRYSASLGGVIKRMRLLMHSPYVSLDFSDDTAAKPSISHDAFSGMQFVVVFEFLMRKFLKEAFSDWRKCSSSVAIDNGTGLIGYWNSRRELMPLRWWYQRLGNLLSCGSFSFSLFKYLINFSLLGCRTLQSL